MVSPGRNPDPESGDGDADGREDYEVLTSGACTPPDLSIAVASDGGSNGGGTFHSSGLEIL